MIKDLIETFNIGASYIIGSYILPGEPLIKISEILNQKIKLNIISCDRIIEELKSGELNLGLIENPLFKKELSYIEWLKDELVICSKEKLPPELKKEELKNLNLITREKESPTKKTISNFFRSAGISYSDFNSTIKADNPTALIQGVKWSKPNRINPTVSIVSKIAIEDEIKRGFLYISRIENLVMERTFYLVYNSKYHHKTDILKVAKLLQQQR
jgi:DNA-binding transcriptional LysR family regulator